MGVDDLADPSNEPAEGAEAQAVQAAPPARNASIGLQSVKRIETCSGSGHDQASCFAFCPSGYMATGGGCRTDTVYWDISESYPVTNTEAWFCAGNEDFKSQVYDRNVTGYVVCVQ
jgi:hypothetical protein